MSHRGNNFFLRTARESEEVLHSASLLSVKDQIMTVAVDDLEDPLEPNEGILIYFYLQGQFVLQAASVDATSGREPKHVTFHTLGEPISAENRKHARISTANVDLSISLADSEFFQVIDVSKAGIGVIAPMTFNQGQNVCVCLRYHRDEFFGMTSVRNVIAINDRHYRYGLKCVDAAGATEGLVQALEFIVSDLHSDLRQPTEAA